MAAEQKSDENPNIILQRLMFLMNESNVTARDLSEKTKIGYPRMKKFLTGETGMMKTTEISSLAKYFDVSPAYVMGWENTREWTFSIKGKHKFSIRNVTEKVANEKYYEFLNANNIISIQRV